MTESERTNATAAAPSFRLDGQVAVVTGASRNIGAAIAHGFAAAGADIVLVGRSAPALTAAADAIRAHAPERRLVAVPADMGRTEDVARVVDATIDTFGRADIVVNNAAEWGPPLSGPDALTISDEQWQSVLQTNLLGPYRLIAGIFGERRDQHAASVINVLSGAGFQPSGTATAYGVSKAALWMLTRYLAVELAPSIRVNAVVPGIVSEDGEPRWSGHTELLESGAVPMRRMGLPDEIVGAALYLASPAASYTTGTVIFCNGGTSW
jgi:NAD(P)-dependent dehydrogenase (short-subunit alcohol dehydrogenase family)